MFEIDTLNGVISSTSDVLAEAMAELIASECVDYRATEQDLMAAVTIDLNEIPAQRGARTSAA